MKLLNNLLTSLTQYENEMIQIRRHLHQYPEISFQELKIPYCSCRFCCKVFQKIYFSVKLRKKTETTE